MAPCMGGNNFLLTGYSLKNMFGDFFKTAYQAASNAGRTACDAVSSGVEKVGVAAKAAKDYTIEKANQAKNYTVEKANQAKNYGVEKASQVKNYGITKATEARDFVIDNALEAFMFVADHSTGMKEVIAGVSAEVVAGGPARMIPGSGTVRDKVRDAVTKKLNYQPVNRVSMPCPKCGNPVPDIQKDGKFMIPLEGGGCAMVDTPPQAPIDNEGKQGRLITYVNGIFTTSDDHCATLHALKNSTGASVFGVYNATESGKSAGLSLDVWQTDSDRQLILEANRGKEIAVGDGRNPAVDTLSEYISSQVAAGQKPEIWSHSQGGAALSLALYDARNALANGGAASEPLSGVTVKSFGSAAPQWPNGPTYEHYVHVDDPVPTALGLGRDPAAATSRAGKDANGNPGKVIYFSGNPGGPFETTNPKKGIPSVDSHDVQENYLKMEKQQNSPKTSTH